MNESCYVWLLKWVGHLCKLTCPSPFLIVHIDSPPRRLMRPPFPSELTVSITKKGPTSGTFTLRAHAKLFSSYETYILASLQSDVTMRRGKGGG